MEAFFMPLKGISKNPIANKFFAAQTIQKTKM